MNLPIKSKNIIGIRDLFQNYNYLQDTLFYLLLRIIRKKKKQDFNFILIIRNQIILYIQIVTVMACR